MKGEKKISKSKILKELEKRGYPAKLKDIKKNGVVLEAISMATESKNDFFKLIVALK